MAFTTVGDLITQAYVLLQDEARERYSEASVYQALNEGLLESARLRPDFFRGVSTPQYSPADLNAEVSYPEGYRPALVGYVASRVQLRDDEAGNEARVNGLYTSFVAKLTGIA